MGLEADGDVDVGRSSEAEVCEGDVDDFALVETDGEGWAGSEFGCLQWLFLQEL